MKKKNRILIGLISLMLISLILGIIINGKPYLSEDNAFKTNLTKLSNKINNTKLESGHYDINISVDVNGFKDNKMVKSLKLFTYDITYDINDEDNVMKLNSNMKFNNRHVFDITTYSDGDNKYYYNKDVSSKYVKEDEKAKNKDKNCFNSKYIDLFIDALDDKYFKISKIKSSGETKTTLVLNKKNAKKIIRAYSLKLMKEDNFKFSMKDLKKYKKLLNDDITISLYCNKNNEIKRIEINTDNEDIMIIKGDSKKYDITIDYKDNADDTRGYFDFNDINNLKFYLEVKDGSILINESITKDTTKVIEKEDLSKIKFINKSSMKEDFKKQCRDAIIKSEGFSNFYKYIKYY